MPLYISVPTEFELYVNDVEKVVGNVRHRLTYRDLWGENTEGETRDGSKAGVKVQGEKRITLKIQTHPTK
jgi:hypothetical protein